jgi:hypothetical protein
MLSSFIFTPFAFGQDLQKSTWLESASIIYDQKFAKAVQTSVAFETINNHELQFPDELLEKIMLHEEIRFIFFTNMDQCVMGVSSDDQCIMIGFNLDMLKGDLGINAIHENGKKISDELISDINNAFGMNAKFHSIYLHMDDENQTPIGSDFTSLRTASAVFTIPRDETSTVFAKLSDQLINQQLRSSGGFYDVAKKLAQHPNSIITVGMISQDVTPMMLFKVSTVYEEYLDDVSIIKPLDYLGVNELERSKYFADHFVPLNSVVQVIIMPDNPSKIDTVNTNIITKLDSVEDLIDKGWFFTSTSYDTIDARFLFGASNSVNADELVMELSAWNMQDGNDSFSTENINIRIPNTEGEQYAILAVIIIAAIGAAIFYLKGYKRNR